MTDTITTGTTVANSELSIITPELSNTNGQITTTSLQVAQHFTKAHNHVMRDIRKLECSDEFRLSNFGQSSYANEQGKQQPMFHITKDGFMFLAMGFTGKEAAQWKEAYIAEFNRREAELTKLQSPSDRIAYSVNPTDTLTAAQSEQLRLIFKDKCDTLPKDDQAGFMIKAWSKMKSHFGVAYRKIPQFEFSEAVSLATRHCAEWGALPAQQQLAEPPSLKNRRWLISFDHAGREQIQPVEWSACILTYEELPKLLKAQDNMVSTDLLAEIGNACFTRLQTRISGFAQSDQMLRTRIALNQDTQKA